MIVKVERTRIVLVSAIACAPYGGSEGGVGWKTVLALSEEYTLKIITHEMNRGAWEKFFQNGGSLPSAEVRFVGEPVRWHPNRLLARCQSWLQYIAFNRLVLQAAEEWYEEEPYDLAHHVTYAAWRVPSALWQLPVPFIWGPIGGAGVVKRNFYKTLSIKSKLFELARVLQGKLAVLSPSLLKCIKYSSAIIAVNEETEELLRGVDPNARVTRSILTYLTPEEIERFKREGSKVRNKVWKLFAGGNIIGTKGLKVALDALLIAHQTGIQFHYTIAGGGPEIEPMKAYVQGIGLGDFVTFHDGYRGDAYIKKLHQSDFYFLPSYRETLGLTLQESILAGCYPIVANMSGAGELIRQVGGSALDGDSPDAMATAMARELLKQVEKISLDGYSNTIRDKLLEVYSKGNYMNRISEVYEMVLKEGKHEN